MVFFMSSSLDQIQEEQPKALDISQVKINQDMRYSLQRMLTWRYNIGDTIIFTYKPTSNSYNRPNQTFHQCLWRRADDFELKSYFCSLLKNQCRNQ